MSTPAQKQQLLDRDEEMIEQDRIDERFAEEGLLPSWKQVDELFNQEDKDGFLELLCSLESIAFYMTSKAEDYVKIEGRGPIRGKRFVFDYATKAGLGLRKIA